MGRVQLKFYRRGQQGCSWLDVVCDGHAFDEGRLCSLLRAVRPDVYVKGGDYAEASLPEAATARELGVELVFIPLVEGHSTSELLRNLSS